MKKLINITICVFALFSAEIYSQEPAEEDFFCCSVYELNKTSTEITVLKKTKARGIESQVNGTSEIINIEANETFRDENKQITILHGDTQITRGSEVITSQLTNVLQLEDRARLSGNVTYRNEGLEVDAPYAEYNTKTSRSDFLALTYKYPSLDISGKASYGVRLKNKKMFLKNSTYTTCDLINPDWNLISKTTELDFEKGIGRATNVFITVKGMPVFYSPYMQFSLDEQRKTGFLVPGWTGSWAKGPDVFTPFYWNIAPNMDMLIQPSYIQERGSKIESNFRYLNKEYGGSMYVSYLADDSEYSAAHGAIEQDRYRFLVNHEQRINKDLRMNMHYEKVSDSDYYNDFSDGISDASKSYGFRNIEAIYDHNDWRVYGEFLGYQTYDKTVTSENQPYDLLPKIEVSKRWDENIINYDFWSSFTKWDHDHNTKVDGTRADFQFGIDKTYFMKGLEITPRLKLQHTQYNLDNQNSDYSSNPSKTIPIFSLNSEMIFSKKISKSDLVHQIKPRLFYLYSEEVNQDDIPIFDTGLNSFSYSQMFRDNSFSGADRNSDANQLSISLSSNFYDLESFRNIFNISIGRIVYFQDRKVSLDNQTTYTRTNSNLIAEMEYKPTENISLISTFLYDTHGKEQKTQYNNHTFQYKGEDNNIFNASYRYSKNSTAQGDMSFAWGVSDNLKLLGRWNYDLKNNSNNEDSGDDIETLAGLEYESCCWKVRLVQRKFKVGTETYEKDIQFQIMLKGFTDVGTPLGDLISSSIKGYTDKEY